MSGKNLLIIGRDNGSTELCEMIMINNGYTVTSTDGKRYFVGRLQGRSMEDEFDYAMDVYGDRSELLQKVNAEIKISIVNGYEKAIFYNKDMSEPTTTILFEPRGKMTNLLEEMAK